jgi:hypothetical protein
VFCIIQEQQQSQWNPDYSAVGASQVKLLITDNAFSLCKEQQHIRKQDFFRDFGVAEAPPGFQAGWSDCM